MTTDKISLERIKLLHPVIRDEVMFIYLNQIVPSLKGGVYCRITQTLRGFNEQDALYAQGRTTLFNSLGKRLGIVTNAKGGQSYHNYGLAFDFVLMEISSATWDITKDFDGDGKADWMEVVDIFKENGYTWGGDFETISDKPHFEKTFGLDWTDMLEKYRSKDFIPGTNYINI